jgi:hypothetical protein
MKFISNLFESPQTKSHRKSAGAATHLREQAARDLSIELNLLIKYFNTATQLHQKVYSAGNMELAGQFVSSLHKPRELIEHIERVSLELLREIEIRKSSASCAAEFEALATFELQIRNGLIQMKEEIKQYLISLGSLNFSAELFLRGDIAR